MVSSADTEREFQTFVTRDETGQISIEVAQNPGPNSYAVRNGSDAELHEVQWTPLGHGRVLIQIDGRPRVARITRTAPEEYLLETAGRQIAIRAEDEISARANRLQRETRDTSGPATILAPMPGMVVQLLVGEGDVVAEGQAVLIIEAMKMQNEIAAPTAGTVQGLKVESGQAVDARQLLCEIVP